MKTSRFLIGALVVVVLAALIALAYRLGQSHPSLSAGPSPSPLAIVTPPTGTPASTSTPVSPSPTATPAAHEDECATANLTASLIASAGGGAAGTAYYDLALKNSGTADCSLYGFPGVSLLNTAGTALGTASHENISGTNANSHASIAPGSSAYFALGVPNAGNFEPGTCTAGVSSLKVYPPDNTEALTVANANSVLGNSYCPGFSVSAVSASKL